MRYNKANNVWAGSRSTLDEASEDLPALGTKSQEVKFQDSWFSNPAALNQLIIGVYSASNQFKA